MPETITIVTWNVLAAPCAAPAFYPAGMDPALLDRHARAELVGELLARLDADVMCLQETTPPDLAVVLARLGPAFLHHAAPNGPRLWSNWSAPEQPWEPNGTAIVWRAELFDDAEAGAVALSDDGNVATVLHAQHPGSGRAVRAMSVHLDADNAPKRREQLPVALATFAPDAVEGSLDVVAGDCNEDTIETDLGATCAEYGFADALAMLGCVDPTHPYARPIDDFAPIARLDHVLVRNAIPTAGAVLDSDVWRVDVPGARLAEHLRATGSDHLPVKVSLVC